MLLHLKMYCPKEDSEATIESSQSWCSPNPFGVALYESFLSRVKERFHAVTVPDGETYYVSPKIFPHRHEVTFRILNNAQNFVFRIDTNGNLIKIGQR